MLSLVHLKYTLEPKRTKKKKPTSISNPNRSLVWHVPNVRLKKLVKISDYCGHRVQITNMTSKSFPGATFGRYLQYLIHLEPRVTRVGAFFRNFP